jgi:hypothetical protein
MKYILVYTCLSINILIVILFIYAMFGYRKIDHYELLLLLVTSQIVNYFYHKYKPLSITNLVCTKLGIKLPTWRDIQINIFGTDPKYLDRDKKNK